VRSPRLRLRFVTVTPPRLLPGYTRLRCLRLPFPTHTRLFPVGYGWLRLRWLRYTRYVTCVTFGCLRLHRLVGLRLVGYVVVLRSSSLHTPYVGLRLVTLLHVYVTFTTFYGYVVGLVTLRSFTRYLVVVYVRSRLLRYVYGSTFATFGWLRLVVVVTYTRVCRLVYTRLRLRFTVTHTRFTVYTVVVGWFYAFTVTVTAHLVTVLHYVTLHTRLLLVLYARYYGWVPGCCVWFTSVTHARYVTLVTAVTRFTGCTFTRLHTHALHVYHVLRLHTVGWFTHTVTDCYALVLVGLVDYAAVGCYGLHTVVYTRIVRLLGYVPVHHTGYVAVTVTGYGCYAFTVTGYGCLPHVWDFTHGCHTRLVYGCGYTLVAFTVGYAVTFTVAVVVAVTVYTFGLRLRFTRFGSHRFVTLLRLRTFHVHTLLHFTLRVAFTLVTVTLVGYVTVGYVCRLRLRLVYVTVHTFTGYVYHVLRSRLGLRLLRLRLPFVCIWLLLHTVTGYALHVGLRLHTHVYVTLVTHWVTYTRLVTVYIWVTFTHILVTYTVYVTHTFTRTFTLRYRTLPVGWLVGYPVAVVYVCITFYGCVTGCLHTFGFTRLRLVYGYATVGFTTRSRFGYVTFGYVTTRLPRVYGYGSHYTPFGWVTFTFCVHVGYVLRLVVTHTFAVLRLVGCLLRLPRLVGLRYVYVIVWLRCVYVYVAHVWFTVTYHGYTRLFTVLPITPHVPAFTYVHTTRLHGYVWNVYTHVLRAVHVVYTFAVTVWLVTVTHVRLYVYGYTIWLPLLRLGCLRLFTHFTLYVVTLRLRLHTFTLLLRLHVGLLPVTLPVTFTVTHTFTRTFTRLLRLPVWLVVVTLRFVYGYGWLLHTCTTHTFTLVHVRTLRFTVCYVTFGYILRSLRLVRLRFGYRIHYGLPLHTHGLRLHSLPLLPHTHARTVYGYHGYVYVTPHGCVWFPHTRLHVYTPRLRSHVLVTPVTVTYVAFTRLRLRLVTLHVCVCVYGSSFLWFRLVGLPVVTHVDFATFTVCWLVTVAVTLRWFTRLRLRCYVYVCCPVYILHAVGCCWFTVYTRIYHTFHRFTLRCGWITRGYHVYAHHVTHVTGLRLVHGWFTVRSTFYVTFGYVWFTHVYFRYHVVGCYIYGWLRFTHGFGSVHVPLPVPVAGWLRFTFTHVLRLLRLVTRLHLRLLLPILPFGLPLRLGWLHTRLVVAVDTRLPVTHALVPVYTHTTRSRYRLPTPVRLVTTLRCYGWFTRYVTHTRYGYVYVGHTFTHTRFVTFVTFVAVYVTFGYVYTFGLRYVHGYVYVYVTICRSRVYVTLRFVPGWLHTPHVGLPRLRTHVHTHVTVGYLRLVTGYVPGLRLFYVLVCFTHVAFILHTHARLRLRLVTGLRLRTAHFTFTHTHVVGSPFTRFAFGYVLLFGYGYVCLHTHTFYVGWLHRTHTFTVAGWVTHVYGYVDTPVTHARSPHYVYGYPRCTRFCGYGCGSVTVHSLHTRLGSGLVGSVTHTVTRTVGSLRYAVWLVTTLPFCVRFTRILFVTRGSAGYTRLRVYTHRTHTHTPYAVGLVVAVHVYVRGCTLLRCGLPFTQFTVGLFTLRLRLHVRLRLHTHVYGCVWFTFRFTGLPVTHTFTRGYVLGYRLRLRLRFHAYGLRLHTFRFTFPRWFTVGYVGLHCCYGCLPHTRYTRLIRLRLHTFTFGSPPHTFYGLHTICVHVYRLLHVLHTRYVYFR